MRRIILSAIILTMLFPNMVIAATANPVTTLRLQIETKRHEIVLETIKLERAVDRLSSTNDEVLTNISSAKDDTGERIRIEHEIYMYELEILDLKQLLDYAKLEREREYVVDYAAEGDKDEKAAIKAEYEDDIQELEDDYSAGKDDLQQLIDDLEEELSSITTGSLNYKTDQENDRHTDKVAAINGIDRTEDEETVLLVDDMDALQKALSSYKAERNDYEDLYSDDWNDDSESAQNAILDEIEALDDDESKVKDDLLDYYTEETDEIDAMIEDRNNESDDITDEFWDLSPTSQSRTVAQKQIDELRSQIDDLRDEDNDRQDWYNTWSTDISALFDDILDELNVELGEQTLVLQDKTETFTDAVYDLDYDTDALVKDLSNKAVFADVPEGHDFFDAVNYLYDEGITTGRTATLFAPDEKVLREEFITFIMRAKYTPTEIDALAINADMPATDVPATSSLYKYVVAAYKAGITTGRTETTFGFGEYIRRDEAVVMLVRAYGLSGDISNMATTFTDISMLSEEFQQAIMLMTKFNIIRSGETFRPHDPITRGESAKIIRGVDTM